MKQNDLQISEVQQQLARDVRMLIEQKKLVQHTIAAACGCHRSSVSHLLQGTRAVTDEWLSRMRHALQPFMPEENLFDVRQQRQMRHIADVVRKERLFALVSGNTGIGKTTALRDILAVRLRHFMYK